MLCSHVCITITQQHSKPEFVIPKIGSSAFGRKWRVRRNLLDIPLHSVIILCAEQCQLEYTGTPFPSQELRKSEEKRMDVHSWCSMLGRGATNQFNFFVWSIYTVLKSERFSANTAYNFWCIYTWSLYWLDRGLWPDRDWLGNLYTTGIDFARRLTPLAGVVTDYYFGVLWGIKNDLEYSWKELKLPNCN